jgi:hypothetical protein
MCVCVCKNINVYIYGFHDPEKYAAYLTKALEVRPHALVAQGLIH